MTHSKIRRLIESFAKEWTQNITKEVSVVQNRIAVHGQYNIYTR